MGIYTTQSLCRAGITFSGIGTITIKGKSYNIPPIESLTIGKTKKYDKITVWRWWFYAGYGGVLLAAISRHLWLVATIASPIAALILVNLKEYALFYETGAERICIYSSPRIEELELIRKDIIKMSDPSCIADMQVGWKSQPK